MSAKQAINDKLQGNVAVYLRCGGTVNKQRFIAESESEKNKIGVYLAKLQTKRDRLVHFLRLLAVCWTGSQSARDNDALACNFAKYSPV